VGHLVEGARAVHGGHTLTTAWLSAGSGLLLLPLLVLPAHRKAAAAEGWTGAAAPRLRGGELSPAAYALVRRICRPLAFLAQPAGLPGPVRRTLHGLPTPSLQRSHQLGSPRLSPNKRTLPSRCLNPHLPSMPQPQPQPQP